MSFLLQIRGKILFFANSVHIFRLSRSVSAVAVVLSVRKTKTTFRKHSAPQNRSVSLSQGLFQAHGIFHGNSNADLESKEVRR